MAKAPKPTSTAVAVADTDAKLPNVGQFARSGEAIAFAAALGVDLEGSPTDRADLAAAHMNRSQRHMLASGLLLASIKADCDHGEFTRLTEERGFERHATQRAMQYAAFMVSRSPEERELLIGLPKSKVLALAGADAQVIEAVLSAEGEHSIDMLSVRALHERVRELEANAVDTSVQLQTAEANLAAAEKKLAKGGAERDDGVPVVVANYRAEIGALVKKAELAIAGFHPLGIDLCGLEGTEAGSGWGDATIRLAVAALASVHLQVHGLIKQYAALLPDGDVQPTDRSRLTKMEVVELAQQWIVLTQADSHEKALRDWEAEQRMPKKVGRPSAPPKAPKKGGK